MKSKRDLERTIRKERRIALIVNTRSRQGSRFFGQAETLLKARGFHLTWSHAIKNPRNIDTLVQRALATKPDLLVVGSGDGTVSQVVNHIANKDVVLGFIPLGTTNNFARSLGIPLDVEGAIEVIATGKVADVDLGKVGDDHFANVAAIGLSVAIAGSVSAKLKHRIGRTAYVIAGLRSLFHHRAFTATIKANGKTYEYRTHQIIIANGRFHGGSMLADDASIDDHSLVIFHLGDTRKLQLIRSMILFGLKRPRTLREGNFIITDKATITTHPSRYIEMDGEIRSSTPAKVSVASEALKIMVGKDFVDD